MNFYSVWSATRELGVDDEAFVRCFLQKTDSSLYPLYSGSKNDLAQFTKIIEQIPASQFIGCIGSQVYNFNFDAAEIPCFSTFENGASRLNELLEFAADGLTYAEIGFQLKNTPNQLAQIKYGENHAKLAAMMSLVTISSQHRPAIVKATALGRYLTALSFDMKSEVLRKLLMRDYFVQCMISKTIHDGSSYRKMVKALSDSTAYRRRTSVKCIIDFVLDTPDTKYLLDKIDWDM